MLERRYVIDTTVIVAWLLKPNGLSGRIVRSLELELYTPYKAVDELWSHFLDKGYGRTGDFVRKTLLEKSYPSEAMI